MKKGVPGVSGYQGPAGGWGAVKAVTASLFSQKAVARDIIAMFKMNQVKGFDCPGCGSQRAIHHLLHFRLKDAFTSNPLLILAIPYLIIGIYFEYFGGKEKYPTARKTLFGKRAIIIVLILIVLFWIGRNISFS